MSSATDNSNANTAIIDSRSSKQNNENLPFNHNQQSQEAITTITTQITAAIKATEIAQQTAQEAITYAKEAAEITEAAAATQIFYKSIQAAQKAATQAAIATEAAKVITKAREAVQGIQLLQDTEKTAIQVANLAKAANAAALQAAIEVKKASTVVANKTAQEIQKKANIEIQTSPSNIAQTTTNKNHWYSLFNALLILTILTPIVISIYVNIAAIASILSAFNGIGMGLLFPQGILTLIAILPTLATAFILLKFLQILNKAHTQGITVDGEKMGLFSASSLQFLITLVNKIFITKSRKIGVKRNENQIIAIAVEGYQMLALIAAIGIGCYLGVTTVPFIMALAATIAIPYPMIVMFAAAVAGTLVLISYQLLTAVIALAKIANMFRKQARSGEKMPHLALASLGAAIGIGLSNVFFQVTVSVLTPVLATSMATFTAIAVSASLTLLFWHLLYSVVQMCSTTYNKAANFMQKNTRTTDISLSNDSTVTSHKRHSSELWQTKHKQQDAKENHGSDTFFAKELGSQKATSSFTNLDQQQSEIVENDCLP